MAAGSEAAAELQEEATCAICLDLFRSPVMLDCGHNFCRACIDLCWARAAEAPSCPQCRRALPGRSLRPNRQLGNIAAGLRRLGRPAAPRQDKVKAERQKIASEFKQLQQYLVEQECQLMARLGEVERQIETRVKENADKLSKRIFHLDGLIREKEESQLSGCEFPQDTGNILSRCEKGKFQQKEWMSHDLEKAPGVCSEKPPELEETARKLQDASTSALGEEVEESQGLYTKVNVTLDPDTAQSRLILSEDRKRVMQGATQQHQPDNPERFDPWPCVLGCEGFDSGRPCWEVEVGCGSRWAVGVALESVRRKGPIDMNPVGGIWAVGRYKEKFHALTSPTSTPFFPSMVPRRVRVCVNHAEGRVTFVNADNEAAIFTFLQATFSGKRIYPWLWVGKGSQLKL
ncbi:E3 ubiquitin-protein ligase TRIM7-like isoform X2 [Cygnus olor]|uniref:E3 ubiquitin-protein ligase TRIM7-like isoform X2 n=1 Tax=Cygnus olor TaxID=8869 RepID=UPI001ADEB134|nr:E3 ubiquitin-protein ligase TRIM7-like isoform X2 [Cygnus olor]